MASSPSRDRTAFPWGKAALGWAAVALFFVVYGTAARLASGAPIEPLGAAVMGLHWFSWTLVTPLLVGAARRLPLEPGRRGRRLAAHAVLAVEISVALSALNVATAAALRMHSGAEPFPMERAVRVVLGSLATDVLVYTAFVAVATAVEGRRRAAQLEGRAVQLEAQLAQAHLQALRMQLNPHFLFNALQTVSALTSPGDHKARRVVRDLGDLLRLSFERTGVQEVPLEEEVHFLERYIDIERVRFQDRLTVVVDVDDDTLRAAVPTLLLQPLVENAVKHGVAPREGPVRVEVRARRDGDRLSVRVADDGGSDGEAAPPSTGVGLANLEDRLGRLYGSAASLSHGPEPSGGYAVHVVVPFRTAEREQAAPATRPPVHA